MASSPSTSWQIDEETMEIMTDFMATHSSTLPGKFYGQRILVGYNPWRHKELDMTEWLHFQFHFIYFGSKITADGDCSHEIKRWMLLGRKAMTNLDSKLKTETLLCQQRSIYSKLWFFQWSCMDVRVGLWRRLSAEELMLLNCGLEKTLENLLDCKEIQPVHPKGNQSWIFIGRTDAEAEAPIFWQPDVQNWLTRKDLDAGKDWRQEEKGLTEDEMVGWYHQLNRHEFE